MFSRADEQRSGSNRVRGQRPFLQRILGQFPIAFARFNHHAGPFFGLKIYPAVRINRGSGTITAEP
jgi:hypothetical protein